MKEKPKNKDLFVSDISFDAEEDDLRKLFAVCGTVRSVRLLTDQRTGQFNGCAFVSMSSAAEAKDALQTLDGALLINRCISIKQKREKQPLTPAPEEPTRQRRLRRPRRTPRRRQ